MRKLTQLTFAVAMAVLAATPARAQQTYPNTLYWESGLVDIPVAWVSPLSGDFTVAYSGKRFTPDPNATKIDYNDKLNSQLVLSGSLFGRLEGGFAAFSSNPEYGFFGRALLLRNEDSERFGFAHWFIPAVALGVRNVGQYPHIDRFGIGYNLLPPSDGTPNANHQVDSLHTRFNTNNTYYAVATKEFSLQDIRTSFPAIDFSLTYGYGNGLFKDDGGLGKRYAQHATGGSFYGAKIDWNPFRHLTMSLMGENNAWDRNAGAVLDYRGLRAGVYVTEIGAGSASPTGVGESGYIYNYQKTAFTFGWQSNIYALLRGDVLQRKERAMIRQRDLLVAEIAKRQQRIAGLELEINQFEAQGLLDLQQRRAAAQVQLRDEKDALQRLQDRLKRLEAQGTVPPAASPTTPPPFLQ